MGPSSNRVLIDMLIEVVKGISDRPAPKSDIAGSAIVAAPVPQGARRDSEIFGGFDVGKQFFCHFSSPNPYGCLYSCTNPICLLSFEP